MQSATLVEVMPTIEIRDGLVHITGGATGIHFAMSLVMAKGIVAMAQVAFLETDPPARNVVKFKKRKRVH